MKICHDTEHQLDRRSICGQIQDVFFFNCLEAIKEAVLSIQGGPKFGLRFRDKQHFSLSTNFKMAAEVQKICNFSEAILEWPSVSSSV